MKKFIKKNWKALLFVPSIILVNLTPQFWPNNNIWWYELSGNITIFLVLMWLYIDSKRSEYEFSRFIIGTGVVTSLKGVLDYMLTADQTNTIFIELVIYGIIVVLAIHHYNNNTASNTTTRHRG